MTALALLVTQNVFAADPDLSGYTAIKTMDFSKATYASDVNITLSTTQCGTAFETGNKLYQKVYEVATPEDLQGYLALQGVYPKKGWWIRSTKGGLYSISGSRSGAVINLKKDYVVAFNCTQDAEKVMSLINDKGEPDGSFTYEKSEDTKTYYATMTADGQVNFCGNKNAGYISSIVIYAPGTVVVQPTAAYTAVNGASRTVTFTGANLAYNTDGSDTYTNFKDGDGNNVNKAEVTVSETTTYYVVSTNGEQKSDVLQFTIEAGTELSLATPVASITKMGEGFARTYSVVCNNKDVLLTPTAKLTYDFTPSGEGEAESGVECNGTIEATAAGTYVVTASAEGYTSTSVTINNTKEYELTKTIDLTTLKAEDLSANWKKKAENTKLDGSDSQWRAKYGNVVTDKYFYDFSAESASATDVLAGLNVEINKDGKAPVLFKGFGMMYPVYQMNAEGDDNTVNKVAITNGKLSIAEGTADQVGVYTYINNYGKNGTKTAIVAGDKEFALYRFSDMLTKVEIYSPKITETVSVSDAGYATYATTNNIVVPKSNDVEVMTVKVNDDNSTITLNKVEAGTVIPANTGILVKADQGNHDFVVTSDKGKELENNSLVAAKEAVPSDGSTYFALTTLSDGKVGFAVVKDGVVIPAGKAYLMVENGTPAKFFGLDGEATGINSVKTAKADGAYYTLEGVKTTKPVKGLYIHNGKKIVVK